MSNCCVVSEYTRSSPGHCRLLTSHRSLHPDAQQWMVTRDIVANYHARCHHYGSWPGTHRHWPHARAWPHKYTDTIVTQKHRHPRGSTHETPSPTGTVIHKHRRRRRCSCVLSIRRAVRRSIKSS